MSLSSIVALSTIALGRPVSAHTVVDQVQVDLQGNYEVRAGKVMLRFLVRSEEGHHGKITQEHLMRSQGALLHAYVLDPALEIYHHLIPEFRDGYWRTTVDLPRNGVYNLWVRGVIAGKEPTDFAVRTRFRVKGGESRPPVREFQTETRTTQAGDSQIHLLTDSIIFDETEQLRLRFERPNGSSAGSELPKALEAHALAVGNFGQSVILLHPMPAEKSDELILHIHGGFPSEGIYRLWIDFTENGKSRRAALGIRALPQPEVPAGWFNWLTGKKPRPIKVSADPAFDILSIVPRKSKEKSKSAHCTCELHR